MKKILCTLLLTFTIVHAWANTEEKKAKYFEFFDYYLNYYDTQRTIGKTLTLSSIAGIVLGSGLATTGISLQAMNTSDDNTYTSIASISGYSLLGLGVVGVIIGFPLWIQGYSQYNYILEKRDRYFWMIH